MELSTGHAIHQAASRGDSELILCPVARLEQLGRC